MQAREAALAKRPGSSIPWILLFCFMTFLVVIVPGSQARAQDSDTSFKPFLGSWVGEWSFGGGGNSWGGRPCKLSIYVEGSQVYVDYSVGAQSSMGTLDSSAGQQTGLKAEVKKINGIDCLVFATKGANEYRWFIENGKLVGQPNSDDAGDARCTLSRARVF